MHLGNFSLAKRCMVALQRFSYCHCMLSVYLSVTRVYCDKTAEIKTTWFSPQSSSTHQLASFVKFATITVNRKLILYGRNIWLMLVLLVV